MRLNKGTPTKEKLLDTATRLMCEHGYTATRVEQICQVAGVTKGAFFHYFKTKDDLARQAAQFYFDVEVQSSLDRRWPELDATGQLFRYLELVRDTLGERAANQGCLLAVLSTESVQDEETAMTVKRLCELWLGALTAMISAASVGKNIAVSAEELAEHFFVIAEGCHIAARVQDLAACRFAAVENYRRYLALILGVSLS